jgi:hypothetical protein
MKLFFLWPTFQHAVEIAQRVEFAPHTDIPSSLTTFPSRPLIDNAPVPMDIDVQNAEFMPRRRLPHRDPQGRLLDRDPLQGRPHCFFCNNYGHVLRYCRKKKAQQLQPRQFQNTKITSADAASLAKLP